MHRRAALKLPFKIPLIPPSLSFLTLLVYHILCESFQSSQSLVSPTHAGGLPPVKKKKGKLGLVSGDSWKDFLKR